MNISYGKQFISNEDINEVIKSLTSDFLTQGPKVTEFESKFAEYIGSKFAVAVSNGTAALHLCAMALNVKEGVNVITTPITFAASANCVRYCGGNVFFCDINPETFLIDTEKLKQLIASKPKGFFSGIIPVDFAGLAINLEEIKSIADENELWIIEDACHAPGGYFMDSKGVTQLCGNSQFADLAIFSFHPVKHIATGEGGMITTNDKELFEKLVLLRTHGITKNENLLSKNDGGWYYEMQELGFNYRIPDILCALGISQLKRANEGLIRRREIARKYFDAFKNHRVIKVQPIELHVGHAFHLFIIQVSNRRELYDYLKSKNIFAQVHYIPVHTMPYYKGLGYKDGDFPIAENYYRNCLSIPMYPSLSNNDQEMVIKTILDFYGN
jgi:UDP-4-amino-4,6-dideoxy-N-acetyl-beta-L-altrosamine transaminase